MTLPVMEPDLWAAPDTLERWSRAVDEGPYASLCFGERVAFDNPETLTLLGAVSAWTSRVRLVTTVIVPQLHQPVPLAKALATADRLSRGRLTVGLGVGGREEDYRAAGSTYRQSYRTLTDLAEQVRAVWRDGTAGPPPLQDGGPPLLVGTMGPRTLRSAASWASGLAGVTLDLDVPAVSALYDVARSAWAEAGRPAPLLTTSFWVALSADRDAARAQVHRHLRHYMDWIPASLVDAMAPTTGFAGTPAELRDLLRRLEDAGTDEVHLIPTSSDVVLVDQVAELA
ncbi:LLM class flavin-dependent oxidoreductase [Nocardioides anomalus]|uniref:LLM class flavin-dependent oxidoreductase n=2 Tax=Nocardioides anomalus TaxID=2712223 RepID=A0A6G6WLS4_9ACTN|nr:LLM class flavin-dependent oxidoreductase [Nocardioides anomalus]